MKKAVLLFCLLFSFAFFLIIVWPTQTLSFSEIPVLTDAALNEIADQHTTMTGRILSFPFTVHGELAPTVKMEKEWYVPALTDDLMLDLPQPWHVARGEVTYDPTDGDYCRVLIYNSIHCIEYTVIETGLPVISIIMQQFDLHPKYIENWRTPATANILTQTENGSLSWLSSRIDIKTRGNSSLVYPKKSYTVFFVDGSGNDVLQSPLGLPADRKFALNSMFEDDSKIRDVLSYRLWSYVEPENALQMEYAELIMNDEYFGLYGMHGLPTENSLPFNTGDTIYKINGRINQDASQYRGDELPKYEIVAGDPLSSAPLQRFMQQFAAETESFPAVLDRENFVNNAVFREILASEDTYLQNMVITYCASDDRYRLTPWDLDQSFGNVFDGNSKIYISQQFEQTKARHLAPLADALRLLPTLYTAHPDFAKSVAERYRELRKTIFTDEALLEQAAELYDQLTDCGARQRDAERWPDSAISEDNSFIEAFIPARMAFLDEVFDFDA